MLTVVLFSYGASFVILCADGLTNRQIINTDKFACDLMIANANMCVICLWLLYVKCHILIFIILRSILLTRSIVRFPFSILGVAFLKPIATTTRPRSRPSQVKIPTLHPRTTWK